jgi:regulator of RNase E activity RraA
VVVGDNDCVVIISRDEAEQVLAAARAKEKVEAGWVEKIRLGQSTMDILNLNEAYIRLGLSEEP